MKKILLILILLFSTGAFAQLPQVMEEYNMITVTTAEGNKVGPVPMITRIYFNYRDNSRKAKIYLGSKYYELLQIGDTKEDFTEEGTIISKMTFIDDSDENLYLQYYGKEHIVTITSDDGDVIKLE